MPRGACATAARPSRKAEPQCILRPAHADAQERDVVGRGVVGEEVAEQRVGDVLDRGGRDAK